METTLRDPAVEVPLELVATSKRSLLRDAWSELRATARYRNLLHYLIRSSLRTENANTVLGVFWWVLDPLLQMAVYLVFVGLILGRGGPDYPIFILTGIIAYEAFVKGTNKSINTTVQKERSMRQVAFPKTVLPLSEVMTASVHFMAGFVVLLAVAIPFGIAPSLYALLVVPILLVQLVLTSGVAFFLSALNVFFRDTNKIVDYAFRLGFFLSPILYPISAVPERFRWLFELNPFATLFEAYRAIVMRHEVPDLPSLVIVAGASLVVLVLGYLFFVRLAPWFAKLV